MAGSNDTFAITTSLLVPTRIAGPQTPAPEVTKAPTATPTIAPNVQDTTYTSADKSVSINLPDATWANKTDEADTISFESPDNGNILILQRPGRRDNGCQL